MSDARIRLGVSTCLMGEPVRYDGQHKLDRYVRDVLGQYVDFVPVCPEVECGFPVPRPSFRLVGSPERPRLVVTSTGEDVTDRMEAWATRRARELEGENLCGFIFKSDSPSSGMERVKVYDQHGMPHRAGSGIFARIFMAHFPMLPVEEEGRLHDLGLRENFVERIFALQRWRGFLSAGATLGGLVAFHARHKLLIMSHSVEHYRQLGRLVAGGKQQPIEALVRAYGEGFMTALKLRATRAKQANVLYHVLGFLKRDLDADAKAEVIELIEQYRVGTATLIIPLTLLNHHVRRHGDDYLRSQWYLNPHPTELQLRNHA